MSKHLDLQSIEPEVLAELAEKAKEEENRLQNPYLKALMVRLCRVALELKVALENEGRLDNGCGRSLMKDGNTPRAENESLKTK